MAVMKHSKSVGDLMKDLNKRSDADSKTKDKDEEHDQQSLTAYYYYLSLASLSSMTSTVASSVYQHLPSKEQIRSSVESMSSMIPYVMSKCPMF